MLHLMHSYGIQHLFELMNFQNYAKNTDENSVSVYQSFTGDATINEKVAIVLNQIIAVLQTKTEASNIEVQTVG